MHKTKEKQDRILLSTFLFAAKVVYIGGVNPVHLEMTKLMLSNGKHVLCEKPMGLNVKQTKEMVDLAREKNLFLMEAMWSRS